MPTFKITIFYYHPSTLSCSNSPRPPCSQLPPCDVIGRITQYCAELQSYKTCTYIDLGFIRLAPSARVRPRKTRPTPHEPPETWSRSCSLGFVQPRHPHRSPHTSFVMTATCIYIQQTHSKPSLITGKALKSPSKNDLIF